ncbi:MAG: response regulator [Elusimicrobia bacterium]|nr:response regulator [Elusimicrobiota bacterium]
MACILVVDDERDIVTLIKVILEREGHSVVESYSGADALAKLGVEPPGEASCKPDLLIIDLMMPNIDGLTLTRRLAAHPGTGAIPVMILTAKGHPGELFESSKTVAEVVEKPFDPKSLRETVASIMSKR